MIKPPIDEMIKHIIKVCLLIVENFMLQHTSNPYIQNKYCTLGKFILLMKLIFIKLTGL